MREKQAEKKDVQRLHHLTLLIPENLDIDQILDVYPPHPDLKVDRDYLMYILHLINSIPGRIKDFDFEARNGFTPINKKFLQKRIRNYRPHIDYLVRNEIIEENRQYFPGVQSGGLKFKEKYYTDLKEVNITKWTLINSINNKHKQSNEEAEKKLKFLRNWFTRITIDEKSAKDLINRIYEKDLENPLVKFPYQKKNLLLYPVRKIATRQFDFSVDTTVGRLHTCLTLLKKDLRKFVKFENKNLYGVDITNSQPFLSASLLQKKIYCRNNMEERLKHYNTNYSYTSEILKAEYTQTTTPININYYTTNYNPTMVVNFIEENEQKEDLVSFIELSKNGTLYEEFMDILLQKRRLTKTSYSETRQRVKEKIFRAIYSANTAISSSTDVKDFKNTYPTVYSIYKMFKKGKGQHPALACMLQNFEAELILWNICTRINAENPDIPIFTVHDSIVTTEEYVDYIYAVMEEELKLAIQLKPSLKIEPWAKF